MRVVLFGDQRRVGVQVGDHVVDVNGSAVQWHRSRGQSPGSAQEAADAQAPAELARFIAAGSVALEAAERAVEVALGEGAADGQVHAAGEVQLHAPWPRRRIACAGGNYADHLLGMFAGRPGYEGATVESVARSTRAAGQWGFWKVPDEVVGPDGPVPYPAHSTYLDYEGEAAIVIGRRGKDIVADEVDLYVWGVTLLNDWSTRDRSSAPLRPMSYNTAKNFDGSTSMGPCIAIGEVAWQDVRVETRVNGELRQSYSTADMIFDFGELLAHLSTDFTFVPGDIISGGTAAGTAADTSPAGPDGVRPRDRFLSVGDRVEVSSPAIGALCNTVVGG